MARRLASKDTTKLEVVTRAERGSGVVGGARRTGRVPGVIYGGGDGPVAFEVDARTLRNTLQHAHAVIELSLDGGSASPVMVKDLQRHPVRGEIMHADLLRVRMDVAIQATVTVNLVG